MESVQILFGVLSHGGRQLLVTLEVQIAKQRSGPTGEITLTYIKQYMRLENDIADGAFAEGM